MAQINQNPEQKARDKIDAMLAEAGWKVQDSKKIDFNAGLGIAVREFQTDIGPADYALSHARHVDDEETLLDVARTENENACIPQLPDDEVVRLVRSAWKIQQEGRNFVGGRVVPTSFREIDRLAHRSPDALALLMVLRRYHGCREEFALGKAMASKLGWSLPRFRAARSCLEEDGYITCLHPGGKGKHDPPRYALRGTIPHTNDN